jgi:hypothetical protein
MKHIFEFRRLYLLLFVTVSVFWLFTGCMDTTLPSNTNPYILTVNTYVANPADTNNRAPLSGVTVHLYDLEVDPNNPIQTEVTDNSGQARFNLLLPLIGKTYRVVAIYDTVTYIRNIVLCGDRSEDFLFLRDDCANVCPYISEDGSNYMQFGSPMLIDTLSDRADNRVYISPSLLNPSTVLKIYDVFNPDTSCSSINFTITVEAAAGVIYENPAQYYSIDPMNFVLQPGERRQVTVTFRAPIKDTLDAVVLRRNTRSKIDSMFAIRLRISTSLNCTQDLDLYSIVTAVPELSPIINLRAYNQRTPQKPTPEHEVYYFGNGARTINIAGEYPPTRGHIWVDVDDNNSTATPPQEPILKLVQNSGIIGMKIWRRGFPENDFYNIVQLIADFQNDPAHSTGYTNTELRGIQVGDVIAFQLGPDIYTLIYIRRVDNGTEQTSSKQSGIEFRAISGIYVN